MTIDPRFSRSRFEASADVASLADALSAELTRRFSARPTFEHVREIVNDLRALGHDLYSFDESLDFSAWCDDYTKPHEYSSIVYFRFPDPSSKESERATPQVEVEFGRTPTATSDR